MKRPCLPIARQGLLLGLALWCAALVFLAGCGTTPAALSREQQWYRYGTNTVGVIERTVVPIVPPPYQQMVEGALACAAAALGYWNHNQQKQIKELKNGKGVAPSV